jgi:hypothetical protein
MIKYPIITTRGGFSKPEFHITPEIEVFDYNFILVK